jgi:6-phosphogluconolactonase (cycloisomerase 2 family)
MSFIARWTKLAAVALAPLSAVPPADAGTFVYVSNAEDGDIAMYSMQPNGELEPGPRAAAAKLVMPMAISPDKRFLYAGRALQAVCGASLFDRSKHGRIASRCRFRRSRTAFLSFRSIRPGASCSVHRTAATS